MRSGADKEGSLRAVARAPGSVASGLRLPWEGLQLLRRERRLWPLAAVPLGLSALALGGAALGFASWAPEIHELATGWLPWPSVEAWWQWLWVGPIRAGAWLLGKLLFVTAAVVALVAAFVLASLAAAPFHDELSQRVEALVRGAPAASGSGLAAALRDGGESVLQELRRVAFFLGVWIALMGVGFLVPGAHLLTAPAMTLFTIFFLPLDYSSYALDRRRVPFARRRAWLGGQAGTTFGFGVAAFALVAVPGLNLLAMPVLVVAGTLLVLRSPPTDEVGPSGGAGLSGAQRPADAPAGTPTSP